MPTFASPLLPNVSGLALGSASQPWAAFLTSASLQNVLSLAANAASVGFVRMAQADLLAWRNAANTGNVTLGDSGAAASPYDADLLVWTGSGVKAATFVSSNLPATTGAIRLGDTDTISFRNHANNGNVSIVHNADDSLTLPPTVTASAQITTSVLIASTEVITPFVVPAGSGGTDLLLQAGAAGATGANVLVNGTTGTVSSGGIILTSGNSGASFGANVAVGGAVAAGQGGGITITAGAGSVTNGVVTIAGGNTQMTGTKLIGYNGLPLISNGVGVEVATVDLTAQNAAQGSTTLYLVPGGAGGQHRLSWNAKVETAAGTSSTLGALTIVYTDIDGTAQTITCGAQTSAGAIATTSAGNTTTAILLGIPMMVNLKAATTIVWSFAYASNAASAMRYGIHIRLEAL